MSRWKTRLREDWSLLAIAVGGLIVEAVMVRWFNARYIGVGGMVGAYLVWFYYRLDNFEAKLADHKTNLVRLEETVEILAGPKGYLDYVLEWLRDLLHPSGSDVHARQYTRILAKFLVKARSFIATWTVAVDLELMGKDYQAQQCASGLISKKRYLILSSATAKKQDSDKVAKFVKWHADKGISLYWIDREALHTRLMADGMDAAKSEATLECYEDFLMLDDGSLLFFDTRDTVKEGEVPNSDAFYQMNLASARKLDADNAIACLLFHITTEKAWPKIATLTDWDSYIGA